MTLQIRRVRPDEWQQIRAFRLAALRDEAAPIAFLETHDVAAERHDEFWQQRAAGASEGEAAAQLVADESGRWFGTATVLVTPAGTPDFHGRVTEHRRATVVGVYVDPARRGDQGGRRVIDELLDAAATWARNIGVGELALDVHADNRRAQAAYRRAGFVATGGSFVGPIGPEIDMVRAL